MGVTKYILPVIAGAIGGMILISCGEWCMHLLYPMSPGSDPLRAASLADYMMNLPTQAFVILIVNYIICSFLAGAIATIVARRISSTPAIVVGIVLTLAGLFNAIHMPQPLWVSIAGVLVYLPFTYLGYIVVRKPVVIR